MKNKTKKSILNNISLLFYIVSISFIWLDILNKNLTHSTITITTLLVGWAFREFSGLIEKDITELNIKKNRSDDMKIKYENDKYVIKFKDCETKLYSDITDVFELKKGFMNYMSNQFDIAIKNKLNETE